MDVQAIFGLQFLLSVVVFGLLAKWEVAPRLSALSKADALFWLTMPHAFRHVGMVFLVPGLNSQVLPDYFAFPAAYGDLTAGLLALLTMIALRAQWSIAIALAWIFNVVGTIDLLNALRHAEVVPSFGATWLIPTFIVPLLLVTHFMSFSRLLRR